MSALTAQRLCPHTLVHHAQRQYDAVDPGNRLVARELEKRWNDALEAWQQLEQEYEIMRRTELAPLNEEEQLAVRRLAADLPAIWNAPTTHAVDRKRLLRTVMAEVTLTVDRETRSAECVIVWSGGVVTKHRVQCPPLGWSCQTDPGVIERMRELARSHPDHQIAALLNREGGRTRTGKEWTYQRVSAMRKTGIRFTDCDEAQRNASTSCQ